MQLKETAVSDEVVRSIFEGEFKDLKTKAYEYFVQIFADRYGKEEAEKIAHGALNLIEPLARKQDEKVKASHRGAVEMKIDVVQLENIRSHIKSTVPFTHGFNCVVGGVGCGKSSVLYAVDFALFGDAIGSRSFEYLMREGADGAGSRCSLPKTATPTNSSAA